ncbi:hypothetical protein QTJ16_006832 [Diplocarpon rosae]|uniref:Uncharacterized protein n=1 Tax=Diplocarpon rosae TaxID=946125 RepID=A0AAD9SU65_9HELO|nr:hypothetical protein QTJ16_006832 [Diplocarpon rosae]
MNSLFLSQGRVQAPLASQSTGPIMKKWEHDRYMGQKQKQKKLASNVHEWRAFAQSSSAKPLPPLRCTCDSADTLIARDEELYQGLKTGGNAKQKSEELFPISKNVASGRDLFLTSKRTGSATRELLPALERTTTPKELFPPKQSVAVPKKTFKPEQVRKRKSNEFFSHLGVEKKSAEERESKKRVSLDRLRPTVSAVGEISLTLPSTSLEVPQQRASSTTHIVTIVRPKATSIKPVSGTTHSVPSPPKQNYAATAYLPPKQRTVASAGLSSPIRAWPNPPNKLCAATPYILPHQRAASSSAALEITSNIKGIVPSSSSEPCTATPDLLPHQRAALSPPTSTAAQSKASTSKAISNVAVTPSSRPVTRDDAARRMIFASLGIRIPRRTDEQTKRIEENREARRMQREERERNGGMSLWRASRVKD